MGDNPSSRRDGRNSAKTLSSRNGLPDSLGQAPASAAALALLVIDNDRTVTFVTPAVAAVLGGHPAYIGQSLADLAAGDPTLPDVVTEALTTRCPSTAEIKFGDDMWYSRQIIPVSSPSSTGTSPSGVPPARVIVVYSGLSLHRRALQEMRDDFLQWNLVEQEYLAAARREAVEEYQVRATTAARAIAAVGREQLQVVNLVEGVFRHELKDGGLDKAVEYLALATDGIEDKLHSLGTILDRDRTVATPEHQPVPVQRIFDSVAASLPAAVRAEDMVRIVPSRAIVRTDPRLLARALHALIAHCIENGDSKLVLGCRLGKHERVLELRTRPNRLNRSTEQSESRAARSLWRSIADAALNRLGHRQEVPTLGERVSRYAIAVPIARTQAADLTAVTPRPHFVGAKGIALVVSGDPVLRTLLAEFMRQRGFLPAVAVDGKDALDHLIEHRCRPSLLVGDFDLPGHLDGGDVVALIRETLQIEMPAILLRSGFETPAGLPGSALRRCALLWKPVHPEMLEQRIEELVKTDPWSETRSPATPSPRGSEPGIAILDAATPARAQLQAFLTHRGYRVAAYQSVAHFTARQEAEGIGCVLLDTGLLGAESEQFIESLREQAGAPQVIVLSNGNRIEQAVAFTRAGALDFLPKPADPETLCASIDRALSDMVHSKSERAGQITAGQRVLSLTGRERDILARILEGGRNKTIAYELDVSQRTVEYHRATIMKKMGAAHVTDLVRICAEAAEGGYPPPKGLA